MTKSDQLIGIYVPPPLDIGVSTSIHNSGIGRINKEMHSRLWERLNESNENIYSCLDFGSSFSLSNKVVFKGQENINIDKYFWYCEIERTANSYDLTMLKNISRNIPVYRNPYKYELALDKHTSFSLLRQGNIPVADSLLVKTSNIHDVKNIINSWGRVLLKPRRGGYGKGVTLFDQFEVLRDTVEYIQATSPKSADNGFHIERFYENDIKNWIGITVINGKIAYGYRKNIDRFVSMGSGQYKVYQKDEIRGGVTFSKPSSLQEKIALEAYKALGVEVVGFDMISYKGSPIIIDVNTFPGMYQDLFDEAGLNGGDLFFDLIMEKMY